jgi:hypothetical protein
VSTFTDRTGASSGSGSGLEQAINTDEAAIKKLSLKCEYERRSENNSCMEDLTRSLQNSPMNESITD